MQIFPPAYKAKNDQLAKQPVYVFELIWAGGGHGSEGTNDIYFTTCDVNDILNFPYPARWFPFLASDSISSISQSVDPINGVSTIGELSVSIVDQGGMVSDIIRAADVAGHGLRRQLCEVYMLFKGMDWADKIKVRTMHVKELVLSDYNKYKLTTADVQTRLRKTVFNPYSTSLSAAIATTGAITPGILDTRNFIATTQQVYGTCGFVKIDNEILRWTAKTNISFTIGAADRGLFGSVAATHELGAKVDEIIVLRENPITMALKVMLSTGTGAQGAWDVFPARWGCGMDSVGDVDVNEWLETGKLLAGLSATPAAGEGVQFEFVFDRGIEAKQFIEDYLLKILGAFGFVHADGKYGVRAYSDLSNAAKENASFVADQNSVIKWGDLTYNYSDLTNQVWIDYDEAVKLSGRYIRATLFIDSVSIKKWGEARQLKYSAPGIIPTSAFASQLYQRFQRICARYSRPPMQIELTMMPKYHGIEIGDIGRVTLPIRDLLTGAPLDRAFEVISTQLEPKTGEVAIKCMAQPERAQFWFGGVGEVYSVTISPSAASVVTGQTQLFVARAFDGSGNQIPIPAISWLANGNVTVDATGLVTAGAVGTGSVYAVVGSKQSNIAAVTVIASANTNAVASVMVSPSAVTLATPQTQQLVAQALDVAGNQVQGKVFTWASSNTAAATVPAGPSASATLTAVANGTTNVTATETGTSIASAIVQATVATPQTPVYTPPAILDSAYQIGTKITTHGPVGGPHVIPNGYNFPAGDYWYDGNVSLATGATCTINGTVRIFSLGVITINGLVDGRGRGYASIAGVTLAAFHGNPPNGLPGTLQGFVSVGGTGALGQGVGAKPLYAAVPTLSIVASAVSGGSWAGVVGLPGNLVGSQAGSGSVYSWYNNSTTSGASGESGAGLLLMARGIYLTAGHVDVRGKDGYAPPAGGGPIAGGAGGGGGGCLVCLAEKNVYGLPVMSVLTSAALVQGGANSTSVITLGYTGPLVEATSGGPGCVITMVIG